MKRLVLAGLLILVAAGGGAWAAVSATAPASYAGPAGHRVGLRPTGVGLPIIGQKSTTGASELTPALKAYHDSGAYGRDVTRVARSARTELLGRLRADKAKPTRVCRVRFRPASGGLYRRVRRCHTTRPGAIEGKPAIVLDIDETSLSNYAGLVATNYSSTGTVGPAVTGTGVALRPVRSLYRLARRRHVAVFFITGRPSALEAITKTNLRAQGYTGWRGLDLKSGTTGVEDYKAGRRAAIERRGYDIVVNVGDQESDLDGGHADAAFKLPNPFYFIPD